MSLDNTIDQNIAMGEVKTSQIYLKNEAHDGDSVPNGAIPSENAGLSPQMPKSIWG